MILHHCPSNCHTDPLQSFKGVAGGSFTTPDHEYPSHLELRLTATDSGGLTDTRSIQLDPQTVTLTLNASPGGLALVLNGSQISTPFTRTVIQGSRNSISAPTPQTKGKKNWHFRAWSDGGAQTHDVTANSSTSYTARTSSADPGYACAGAYAEPRVRRPILAQLDGAGAPVAPLEVRLVGYGRA